MNKAQKSSIMLLVAALGLAACGEEAHAAGLRRHRA